MPSVHKHLVCQHLHFCQLCGWQTGKTFLCWFTGVIFWWNNIIWDDKNRLFAFNYCVFFLNSLSVFFFFLKDDVNLTPYGTCENLIKTLCQWSRLWIFHLLMCVSRVTEALMMQSDLLNFVCQHCVDLLKSYSTKKPPWHAFFFLFFFFFCKSHVKFHISMCSDQCAACFKGFSLHFWTSESENLDFIHILSLYLSNGSSGSTPGGKKQQTACQPDCDEPLSATVDYIWKMPFFEALSSAF